MSSNTVVFDPSDPETCLNPYPTYERLRRDAPVHWSPAVRGWVALRYADVQHIMRAADMSADRITPFYKSLSPDSQSKVEILVHYLGRWLVFRDPPDHTRLRSLIARAFTPKALAAVRPNIDAITAHLMHSIEGRTEIDLVTDFAHLLPAYVIMDMLGVPRELLSDMKGWSDDIKLFIGTSQNVPDKYERARRGVAGMADAFRTLIADHRKQSRHDVLSTLIAANEDGTGRLDDEELIATAILFLFAGHETTASLLAMGSMALMANPDAKRRFIADPSLTASTVEECLRFDGPTPSMVRIATRDNVVGEQMIRAGDRVIAVIGSANRDPTVFAAPDVFDITRSPNPHITFGFGTHFCLGAPLARLEAQIALPILHRHYPHMARTTSDVAWADGLTLRGPLSLPVTLGNPA